MKTRTVDTSEQIHDRRNCKNFFHKKLVFSKKNMLCYKWECHSWVPEYLWEWWRVVWWWGRWVAVSAVVASGQQCDMNRARHSPDCQRECRQSSPYYTTDSRWCQTLHPAQCCPRWVSLSTNTPHSTAFTGLSAGVSAKVTLLHNTQHWKLNHIQLYRV